MGKSYYAEIIKLIYDYKGKNIDKKYIDKIIEILVNYYDLNEYVKEYENIEINQFHYLRLML